MKRVLPILLSLACMFAGGVLLARVLHGAAAEEVAFSNERAGR
jgi:hypothetical protein